MLKDEIVFQKEKDSNVQIAKAMIVLLELILIVLFLNFEYQFSHPELGFCYLNPEQH